MHRRRRERWASPSARLSSNKRLIRHRPIRRKKWNDYSTWRKLRSVRKKVRTTTGNWSSTVALLWWTRRRNLRRLKKWNDRRQTSPRDLKLLAWMGQMQMISPWLLWKTIKVEITAKGLALQSLCGKLIKTVSTLKVTMVINPRVRKATIRTLMGWRGLTTYSQRISTSLTTWCASMWVTLTHEMSYRGNWQKSSVNSQSSFISG